MAKRWEQFAHDIEEASIQSGFTTEIFDKADSKMLSLTVAWSEAEVNAKFDLESVSDRNTAQEGVSGLSSGFGESSGSHVEGC